MEVNPEVTLACRRCGYDLRGLDQQADCPECGTPVARSLTDAKLQFSDPDWLATVARGSSWITAGLGFGIASVVFVPVISVLTGGWTPPAWVVNWGLAVGPLLAVGFTLFGVGLFTQRDPSGWHDEEHSRARWLLGGAVLCALLAVGLRLATPFVPASQILDLVVYTLGVVTVAGLIPYAHRCDHLARDAANDKLGKDWSYFRAPVIVLVLALSLGMVGPTVLFGFISFLVFLSLQDRTSKMLAEQARLARGNWDGPPGNEAANRE